MSIPKIVFSVICMVLVVQALAVIAAYQVYRVANPFTQIEQTEPLNEIKASVK